MRNQVLKISDIYIDDKRFLISYPLLSRKLMESIKKIGIINPPVLVRRNGNPIILCGWRRIECLKKMKIKKTLFKIFDKEDDLKAFAFSFFENVSERIFNPVEISNILNKFREFGLSDKNIIRKYLKFVDLIPNRNSFERYIRIGELPEKIKKSIAKGEFLVSNANLLMKFNHSSRLKLFTILKRFHLTASEQREVFEMIWEIMKRDEKSLDGIFSDLNLEEILKNINLKEKKKILRGRLKKLRYPIFSKKIDDFLKNLQFFTEGIRVHPSKYFESEKYRMEIEFKTWEELREKIKEVQLRIKDDR
ncbi:MAG: ParB N-terminal domain-containing protein [Acidobacteriota bacterium]